VGDGRIVLVYLRGTPATLRARLEAQGAGDRPSLTGRGTLAEIESVFAARDGLYRGLASRVMDIDNETTETLTASLALLAGA
jgi:shikimate kinase